MKLMVYVVLAVSAALLLLYVIKWNKDYDACDDLVQQDFVQGSEVVHCDSHEVK